MIEEQIAIKTVFDLSPRDWANMEDWNLDALLEWITEMIPDAEYYFMPDYTREDVNKAQQDAFDQKDEGKTLYMISDDPDVVHWIAFNKKYMPIFMKIKPFLGSGSFIEDFSPHDLTWEGE